MRLIDVKGKIKSLTHWEHWPFFLFYFPVSYSWIGYYIKSRSFWFFTASNPTITFGGMEGEGKREMYELLPPHIIPRSIYIQPSMSFTDVVRQLPQQQITYPFIVKPNVGMKGILFRKIENEQQLQAYHQHMPAEYIIQEFLNLPYEVSLFYCRHPENKKGTITAFIQKDLLEVTGDGVATLEELVAQHPEAKGWQERIQKEQGQKLKNVLKKGERFCLSHIGNRYNGATFTNLIHKVDDALTALFDDISHRTQFYYGRYDIKCGSIDDFLQGKNWYILEFNGAGSIPNHIYTNSYTLRGAYKEILKHWNALYRISKSNRAKGHAYWSLVDGYRFLQQSKKHFKALKLLDKELVLT